jgi:hypothetical protein
MTNNNNTNATKKNTHTRKETNNMKKYPKNNELERN